MTDEFEVRALYRIIEGLTGIGVPAVEAVYIEVIGELRGGAGRPSVYKLAGVPLEHFQLRGVCTQQRWRTTHETLVPLGLRARGADLDDSARSGSHRSRNTCTPEGRIAGRDTGRSRPWQRRQCNDFAHVA
jgi:hypothetical protein